VQLSRTRDAGILHLTSGSPTIPLFAKKRAHSSVPLSDRPAVARSGGQERPKAGARALLLTAASTAARSRSSRTANRRRPAVRLRFVVLGAVLIGSIAGTAGVYSRPAIQFAAGISQPASPFADYIVEASHRFNIPATWIQAVIRVESADNPRALSPKGAIGLMQIMPSTWQDLRVRYGLGADPYDPRDNIMAGAAYLREMYDRFGSPGFLAAYNAGPERYAAHLAARAVLPVEAQNYLALLAPMVGAPLSERPTVDGSIKLHWRSATLFVSLIDRPLSGLVSASSLLPLHPSQRVLAVDLSALVPPSKGLFARLPAKEHVR